MYMCDLAPLFGGWCQSENFSEINPPLVHKLEVANKDFVVSMQL